MIEGGGAPGRFGAVQHELITGRSFPITGQVLTAEVLYLLAFYVRTLLLEVQKYPELEAWI